MRIRRCAVVYLEPREEVAFDLGTLLSGGDGLARTRRWIALAPHLGEEVEVDAHERELLGEVGPGPWIDPATLDPRRAAAAASLLAKGLLIGRDADDDAATGAVTGNAERGAGEAHAAGAGAAVVRAVDAPHAAMRERDERLRRTYWHPLAATLHAFTRWRDVDTVRNSIDSGTDTAVAMREVLGPPPVEAAVRADAASRLALPRSAPNDFDRLLARRVTCRNFDAARALPQALFAQVLERVFAAKAQVRVTGDTVFLKRNVPSGGGLHPMECYLIVQHVEDVPRGLYHYRPAEHALEPLPSPDGAEWTAEALRGFVMDAVAQQHWFRDAHVLVLLAPRFDRTFWKYRHHAKGYRVIALEGGHLSQTLYLAATDAGLGAFITGAINEQTLEHAFGLDPIDQGALALCGFGWRARDMVTAELDPHGEIWTSATDGAHAAPG